jgi:hypothetical protein
MTAAAKYRAALRAFPSAGDVQGWMERAAEAAAAAGIPASVAVAEITAETLRFRPPSPIGEVAFVVARTYPKACFATGVIAEFVAAEVVAFWRGVHGLAEHGADMPLAGLTVTAGEEE